MKRKLKIFMPMIIFFIALTCISVYSKDENDNSTSLQDNSGKNSNTWAEFVRTHDAIGSESGIEVHLNNQTDLENYLLRTGNDLSGDMIWFDNNEKISFPTGKYIFTARTEFYIPTASGDIDFNDASFVVGGRGLIYSTVLGNQNNRSYKNLHVYGNVNSELGETGNGGYNASTNLTRIGWGYSMQAIKASNFKLENLEFNASHMPGSHLFDIMGCTNFQFNDITNRGTLEDWTSEELNQINSVSTHTIYAEMIQIDVTGSQSIGTTTFMSEDFQNNYFSSDLVGDELPTTNTSFTNVRSTSYRGQLGDSIINKTNVIVNKPYSATIGAHSVGNIPYTGIKFTNTTFENVRHIDGNLDKVMAPIHFMNVSKTTRNSMNNTSLTEEEKKSLIRNDTVWQNTDIKISGNKYINCSNEFYDANNPGEKTDTTIYLADFSKTRLAITKINLLDESGNIMKSYNEYVPEEVVYNNYIYKSTTYSDGILNRYYRSPHNEIIEYKSNYDENGKVLNNLDGYKLKSKDLVSETVEELINGDKITVQYTNNIYESDALILIDIPNTAAFSTAINILIGIVLIFIGSITFVLVKQKTNQN